MPCQKTLTIDQAILGETPLVDAVYAGSVDKIFGTMGPYVVKFNATTGIMEARVRLGSVALGDYRITCHTDTGKIFASGSNEINNQWYSRTHLPRDVFEIDPDTLEVTPYNVLSWIPNAEIQYMTWFGPQWIKAHGDYIYFAYETRSMGYYWARVKAGDPTTHNISDQYTGDVMWIEQFLVTDTHFYAIDPDNFWCYQFTLAGVSTENMELPHAATGICLGQDGNVYTVCGGNTLVRIDAFAQDDIDFDGTTTTFDLSTVVGPSVAPDPVRIKCLSDGTLYLPCMGADGFILWDTSSNTGAWRGGFDNPVDVVETDTDVWAVQNAPVGLKMF